MEFTYLPFLLLILLSETLFLLHVEESKLNHVKIIKIQGLIGIIFLLFSMFFVYKNILLSAFVLLLISVVSFITICRILFKD